MLAAHTSKQQVNVEHWKYFPPSPNRRLTTSSYQDLVRRLNLCHKQAPLVPRLALVALVVSMDPRLHRFIENALELEACV
jgi:hypothetical protein